VSIASVLTRAVSFPARITFCYPICSAVLIVILVFNGLINVILSSLGSIYQHKYGFPATTAGLSYLGIGLGGLSAVFSAKGVAVWLARRLGGTDGGRPEYMLPVICLALPVGTVGVLWYGWAIQSTSFWLVPILGLFLFGFGYMSVRVSYRTPYLGVQSPPTYIARLACIGQLIQVHS
jgi:hypothetical protein